MAHQVYEWVSGKYFAPMPLFCYLTIQHDLVDLLTVADKAKTLHESLGQETGDEEMR